MVVITALIHLRNINDPLSIKICQMLGLEDKRLRNHATEIKA